MILMKKLVALILVVLLALSSVSVALADSVPFETKLTGAMDYDIAEWTQSAFTRSLFAVVIALDLYLSNEEMGDIALTAAIDGLSYTTVNPDNSFVGAIYGYGKNLLIVLFDPSKEAAVYNVVELTLSSDLTETQMNEIMDAMVSQGSLSSSYHNETSNVSEALTTVSSALSSD